MNNKNTKQETLRELTFEFDNNLGRTNLNINTLNNMRTLLGHIAEDVEETDKMDMQACAMTMRDAAHKIMILWDLFRHTVEDMEKDLEQTRLIKESYFDLIVRDQEEGEEKNLSPSHDYPFVPMEKIGSVSNE